ncbi:N-acetylneuraminate synthase [Agaricicola taiwanensis]|uniref:N-acetylneuraminate synthase n=1 Tax=Agaricicola taiwanensis TaxID=591372 RepID=A0A8J2VNQ9_9RHOB|nr:N-acetylneuraminate synthase family protein [Agaricicola taiwanensis]GGE35117.1 N-acetylneuraminate synthase [Agaricicola taiwanensis]
MTTPHITIAGRRIGAGEPAFVIAEVGINHGGSEEVAAQMIRAAAQAGADAVKLQTVDADESYAPGTASYAEFKGKELTLEAHVRLKALADSLGLILFTTPADPPSLQLSIAAGFPAIKISSGLSTNLPLIRRCAATRAPLILSTGMAEIADIDAALAAIEEGGGREVAILQCTSLYPAPAEVLNLTAMAALAERYARPVGYSDHHDGTLAVLAAVALGASVIEKHFTLDRTTPGADHALSLEPEPFARMVADIRAVEAMRGDGVKRPTEEEQRLKAQRHRCLTARRHLKAGHVLDEDDIGLMRPLPGQAGLAPAAFDATVGRRLARDVARHQPLQEIDFA